MDEADIAVEKFKEGVENLGSVWFVDGFRIKI
jgi:hypothetical protein